MSDRASSPNLIETGLNGLKSLIGGGRDNYPLISGTNGKAQLFDSLVCSRMGLGASSASSRLTIEKLRLNSLKNTAGVKNSRRFPENYLYACA